MSDSNSSPQYRSRRPVKAKRSKDAASRAAIYTRVSGLVRVESSIERQHQRCEALAKQLGASGIDHFSDESITGIQTIGRVGLLELLKALITKHYGVLIIEDLTRLSRQSTDLHRIYETCKDNDVKIYKSDGTLVDQTRIAFEGVQVEDERSQILERFKHGLELAKQRGMLSQKSIYGFVRVRGDRRGIFEVHPERIEVVKDVFRSLKGGEKPGAIARRFSGKVHTPGDCNSMAAGTEVPQPSPWEAKQVVAIARNPIYMGMNVYGRTATTHDSVDFRKRTVVKLPLDQRSVIEIPAMAVVSVEDWTAAEAATHSGNYWSSKGADRWFFMLTEIAVCYVCRRPLRVRSRDGRKTYACCSPRTECSGIDDVDVISLDRAVLAKCGDRLLADTGSIPSIETSELKARVSPVEAEKECHRLQKQLLNEFTKVSGGYTPNEGDRSLWKKLQERLEYLQSLTEFQVRHDRQTSMDHAISQIMSVKDLKGSGSFKSDIDSRRQTKDCISRAFESIVVNHRFGRIRVDLIERSIYKAKYLSSHEVDKENTIEIAEGEKTPWATHFDAHYENIIRGISESEDWDEDIRSQIVGILAGRVTDAERERLSLVCEALSSDRRAFLSGRSENEIRRLAGLLYAARTGGAEALVDCADGMEFDEAAMQCAVAFLGAFSAKQFVHTQARIAALVLFLKGIDITSVKVGYIQKNAQVVSVVLRFLILGINGVYDALHRPVFNDEQIEFVRTIISRGVDPANSHRPFNLQVIRREIKRQFGVDFVGVVLKRLVIDHFGNVFEVDGRYRPHHVQESEWLKAIVGSRAS